MPDNLTTEQRRKAMAAVKGTNTSLERKVDHAFQKQGWFYSRNVPTLPGKPDFVFDREAVIVFVDGDFRHGWRFPQWKGKLSPYWQKKIERNRKRDRANFQRLRRRGWIVLRFWSHQIDSDLQSVVERVAEALMHGSSARIRKPRRAK